MHCVLRHPLQTDGGAEERWARKSQRAGCQRLARKGNAGQHNHGISQDEGRRECGRVPCRDSTEHREQRRRLPRCRLALWRRRCARRQTSRTKPFRSGRMQHMAIRLHKLVVPWLLICPAVWAARLPVPPVPPSVPPPARVAKVPNHSTKAISTKAVWSRKTPIPPIPPHATSQLAKPAPVPDQDAQPPPDPNSTPHTKVSVANFRRQPTADSGAGFPYGSQFQSREDARPIQTPGLTVTIPLRLP